MKRTATSQPYSSRADLVDQIDVLLDKRQFLMGELTKPTKGEERVMIEKVKKLDLIIN
ncbi:hypothetical protein [Halobacillus mangrovi]|uniref:hypothetical protein n=1 Tax=Halobacillus mangrovi TaxID=402384 RepID=UPI003D9962BA